MLNSLIRYWVYLVFGKVKSVVAPFPTDSLHLAGPTLTEYINFLFRTPLYAWHLKGLTVEPPILSGLRKYPMMMASQDMMSWFLI
jgi:hypothetical protein